MNYLLDTHILLWALQNNPKLNDKTKAIISNPDNKLWFSVASIWEIAIKLSRGYCEDLIEPNLIYKTLIKENYQELTINSYHATAVRSLPFLHKDPFDRMLIVQAMSENFILMTVDDKIKQYNKVNVLMV